LPGEIPGLQAAKFIRGQMKSLSATAQIERAGIERAIRECDYLLELISERRVGLAIELNESHLIRHLLAIRRSYPRTCAGSRVNARRRFGRARPAI